MLVNRSAPVIDTIISPTGKRVPATNRTIPGFAFAISGIPPATITVNSPPNAINAPPKIAITANWGNGRFDLFIAVMRNASAASPGVK